MKNKKPAGKWTRRSRPLLERISPNAAGIDCGSPMHYAAVPPDRDREPVRCFKTICTGSRWLVACSVKTVAMEATGVYLDPDLRDPGGARSRGAAGERTAREERAWTEERRHRLRTCGFCVTSRTARRARSWGVFLRRSGARGPRRNRNAGTSLLASRGCGTNEPAVM